MDIKLLRAKFSWTYIGFIRLNLIMLVTLVATAISTEASLDKFVTAIPLAFAIVNAIVFLVLPVADLIEQYKDKRMCSLLNLDYVSSFLLAFEEKQRETIRDNFKNSSNQSKVKLAELLKEKSKG